MSGDGRPEGGSGNSSSSNRGRNWLIGCGAGCAALVLLGLGLMGSCYAFVSSITHRFDAAVETHQTLDRRFGAPGDFTPWPMGAVPAERMETFIAVREASQPAREQLTQALGRLPLDPAQARELDSKPRGEKLRSVFSVMRSAMGLPGAIGDFFEARNRAMLDHGMGLGEYRYLFALAYPEQVNVNGDSHELHVGTPAGLHDEQLGMLRRQLAALPAGDGPDQATWREQLAEEIRALELDPQRMPWQDGPAPVLAASIAPYRARLDATYSKAVRDFELGRTERKSHFSYTVD